MSAPNYPCDLHVHTVASDGGYPVEILLPRAVSLGLKALAVTDHDTTASVAGGMRLGQELGVKVIPGVELTTGEGSHLLGYFIDPGAEDLAAYLDSLRTRSRAFLGQVIERLRGRGLKVTREEIDRRSGEGIPNMVHLLDVMYRRGDLDGDAYDSASALEFFGGPDYTVNFFREFAAGKPFTDLKGAIGLIRSAGGVPVWAHPYRADRGQVERLAGLGLMGLEVTTPKHDQQTVDHLLGICEEFGLVPTGGTDYHGRFFDSIENGRQIGDFGVGPGVVSRLESLSAGPESRAVRPRQE